MIYAIRHATLTDAPAMHAVMMAAGMDLRSSWSRATLPDLEWSLSKGGGFVATQGISTQGISTQGVALQGVGLQGQEIVGCVGYRPDGSRTLTLNTLATLPELRGQGLGTALVRAVEGQAQRGGFGRVLLAVSQYNLSVVPFYEHLGYVLSADQYAFAHTDSPPPVVLIKGIGGSV